MRMKSLVALLAVALLATGCYPSRSKSDRMPDPKLGTVVEDMNYLCESNVGFRFVQAYRENGEPGYMIYYVARFGIGPNQDVVVEKVPLLILEYGVVESVPLMIQASLDLNRDGSVDERFASLDALAAKYKDPCHLVNQATGGK